MSSLSYTRTLVKLSKYQRHCSSRSTGSFQMWHHTIALILTTFFSPPETIDWINFCDCSDKRQLTNYSLQIYNKYTAINSIFVETRTKVHVVVKLVNNCDGLNIQTYFGYSSSRRSSSSCSNRSSNH